MHANSISLIYSLLPSSLHMESPHLCLCALHRNLKALQIFLGY